VILNEKKKMQIIASLNEYRQSPRKVRLVADLIKGKKIADAKDTLAFLVKRASSPISKLIDSAVANAQNNFNIKSEDLFIKNFRVDSGVTLKRRRPRARGMAYQINKRTSRVLVELDTIDNMKGKSQKAEKTKTLNLKEKK
jgi:large subunit ribosomal protein L22